MITHQFTKKYKIISSSFQICSGIISQLLGLLYNSHLTCSCDPGATTSLAGPSPIQSMQPNTINRDAEQNLQGGKQLSNAKLGQSIESFAEIGQSRQLMPLLRGRFISTVITFNRTIKRVGSIYRRELSGSREKAEEGPLRQIKINYTVSKVHPRNQKEPDSDYHFSSQDSQNRTPLRLGSDCREISFGGLRQQRRQDEEREAELEILKKLKCVNQIMSGLEALKGCSLKNLQKAKLSAIEDWLLEYEGKLLRERKN